jgi:hypothetical protein
MELNEAANKFDMGKPDLHFSIDALISSRSLGANGSSNRI